LSELKELLADRFGLAVGGTAQQWPSRCIDALTSATHARDAPQKGTGDVTYHLGGTEKDM
jgi:hypothetical protein